MLKKITGRGEKIKKFLDGCTEKTPEVGRRRTIYNSSCIEIVITTETKHIAFLVTEGTINLGKILYMRSIKMRHK